MVIVEIKSSVADFRSDGKWPEYLDWCDRFYFAVAAGFPADILPGAPGLIVADAFGGETLRETEPSPLHASRRKALTVRFARTAARRMQRSTGVDNSNDGLQIETAIPGRPPAAVCVARSRVPLRTDAARGECMRSLVSAA